MGVASARKPSGSAKGPSTTAPDSAPVSQTLDANQSLARERVDVVLRHQHRHCAILAGRHVEHRAAYAAFVARWRLPCPTSFFACLVDGLEGIGGWREHELVSFVGLGILSSLSRLSVPCPPLRHVAVWFVGGGIGELCRCRKYVGTKRVLQRLSAKSISIGKPRCPAGRCRPRQSWPPHARDRRGHKTFGMARVATLGTYRRRPSGRKFPQTP